MAKKKVETLIEGGKASPGPAMGQAFGGLGVNLGQIIADINEKTKDFTGMKVPVKVIVDDKTKEYEIEVGTPPASSLIKAEAKIDKGSGNQLNPIGNIPLESAIKIARMKEVSLLGADFKMKVKEIIGTCLTMGITVENRDPREVQKGIDAGKYDSKFNENRA